MIRPPFVYDHFDAVLWKYSNPIFNHILAEFWALWLYTSNIGLSKEDLEHGHSTVANYVCYPLFIVVPAQPCKFLNSSSDADSIPVTPAQRSWGIDFILWRSSRPWIQSCAGQVVKWSTYVQLLVYPPPVNHSTEIMALAYPVFELALCRRCRFQNEKPALISTLNSSKCH